VSAAHSHGSWSSGTPVTDGTDEHGLRYIPEPTCLHLIGQERIGRLGLSVGSLPVILPVNYVLQGRTIVFRSEEGEKTRAAEQSTVACLEVDQFDRFEHSGWSVLATGRLTIAPPDRAEAYERLPVVPWALRKESRFIELSIELLSGRSIRAHHSAP